MVRIALFILKLFLMFVVTMMVRFQIPELRYDFGSAGPMEIASPNDLTPGRFQGSTFAAVRGRPDLERAAVCASHGVPFSYFLLADYGVVLVVRSPEQVTDRWVDIDRHIGRLKPYARMEFRRTVRVGFQQNFGLTIPEDAYFLARDDVPKPNGWSIGATVFASILWCVLAYSFFIHRRWRLWPGRTAVREIPPTADSVE